MDCARRSPGEVAEDPGSIPGNSTDTPPGQHQVRGFFFVLLVVLVHTVAFSGVLAAYPPHSLDPGGLHWIGGDGTVILARSSAAGGLSGTHAGGVLSRSLGD